MLGPVTRRSAIPGGALLLLAACSPALVACRPTPSGAELLHVEATDGQHVDLGRPFRLRLRPVPPGTRAHVSLSARCRRGGQPSRSVQWERELPGPSEPAWRLPLDEAGVRRLGAGAGCRGRLTVTLYDPREEGGSPLQGRSPPFSFTVGDSPMSLRLRASAWLSSRGLRLELPEEPAAGEPPAVETAEPAPRARGIRVLEGPLLAAGTVVLEADGLPVDEPEDLLPPPGAPLELTVLPPGNRVPRRVLLSASPQPDAASGSEPSALPTSPVAPPLAAWVLPLGLLGLGWRGAAPRPMAPGPRRDRYALPLLGLLASGSSWWLARPASLDTLLAVLGLAWLAHLLAAWRTSSTSAWRRLGLAAGPLPALALLTATLLWTLPGAPAGPAATLLLGLGLAACCWWPPFVDGAPAALAALTTGARLLASLLLVRFAVGSDPSPALLVGWGALSLSAGLLRRGPVRSVALLVVVLGTALGLATQAPARPLDLTLVALVAAWLGRWAARPAARRQLEWLPL